jgi:hypothetical protein
MKDIYAPQLDQFESNLQKVIRSFNKRVSQMIADMKTSKGYLTFNDENLNFATQSLADLRAMLELAGYGEQVNKLLAGEDDLFNEYNSLRPAGAVPIAFTNRMTNQLVALRKAELVAFNGIGDQALLEIQKQLINGVISGVSMETVIANIANSLESSMKRYAFTYANTSRARYLQAIEDLNSQERRDGEAQFWEYVGPEDDLNRPACVEGLSQRYFTDAERGVFEYDTADERAWNCRHTFMEISEDHYIENTGGA